MSVSGIKAGGAYVSLEVRNRLKAGFAKATKDIRSWGSSLQRLAGVGSALGGGGLAGSLVAATMHFNKVGDELQEMSQRTGVGVEALSELKLAATLGGVEMSGLEMGIRQMQKALGSDKGMEAIGKLGLDMQTIRSMSPEDQFTAIAGAIDEIRDPAEKTQAALALFGKSGTQILPMIEGLEATRERARELGLTVSESQADAAAQASDRWDEFKAVASKAFFDVGSEGSGLFTNIITWATAFVQHWDATWTLIKNSAILSVVVYWETVKWYYGEVIPSVLSWFADNWINIFRDIGVGAITIVGNLANNIKDIFVRLWDFIASGFEGGLGGLGADIGDILGRDLLEGFEAQTKTLPDIAAREMTAYERELQAGMDAAANKIAESVQKTREFAAKEKGTARQAVFRAMGDDEDGAVGASTTRMKFSGSGTFSAGAGMMFSARNVPAKQIAKNTAETAKNTGKILTAIGSGAVFT